MNKNQILVVLFLLGFGPGCGGSRSNLFSNLNPDTFDASPPLMEAGIQEAGVRKIPKNGRCPNGFQEFRDAGIKFCFLPGQGSGGTSNFLGDSGPEDSFNTGGIIDSGQEASVSFDSGTYMHQRDSGIRDFGNDSGRLDSGLPPNTGGSGNALDAGCSTPNILCGNSCVNLALNNENCGACGYSCVNGRSCINGRPSPAWQSLNATGANVPSPRTRHAAGFLNGKFIIFGGSSSPYDSGMPDTGVYDLEKNEWISDSDMSLGARCAHGSVSTGANIYTFGGLTSCGNGTSESSNELLVYDGKSWLQPDKGDGGHLVYNFAMAWINKNIFIYEGANANGVVSVTQKWSSSDGWSEFSSPSGLSGGQLFLNNLSYIDYWDGSGNAYQCDYKAKSPSWTNIPSPPSNKYASRFADDGRRIFYLYDQDDVTIYDRKENDWVQDDQSVMPDGLCTEVGAGSQFNYAAATAWTGSEMIAWSGYCNGSASKVGGRYQPPAPM